MMVQMPTGTGKTHVLAAVVNEECRMKNDESAGPGKSGSVMENGESGGVWIVAHRRELVAQIEETVERYGIRTDDGMVRVMSVQWLARHWDDAAGSPSLVVIDEAHHALAETYRELWRRYPEARKLGMTATPCRMDRRGFTDLFGTLVASWSIAGFIRKGQLSLFDYVSIRPGSREQMLIDSLEKRGADGDYQIKEMDEVLNRRPGIGRLYESVRKFADNKKGIVYAISISHARRIAEYYSQRGISAVAIDSRTPAAERRRLVEDFKAGKIRVLVNVDVFSEGFDCPDVEFVQMARPTLSLAKYLQQVGRGLRKSAGKETCVLIDNAGLYRLFGLPTVVWDWEAMFRGRLSGKVRRQACRRSGQSSAADGLQRRGASSVSGMEVVVSHDKLPEVMKEQAESRTCPVAWRDTASGLWGLRSGEEDVTGAVFVTVFGTCYGMAAVRFGGDRCGLIDSSGKTLWQRDGCRTVEFTRNNMLLARLSNGRELYVDLYNLRTYGQKPEIRRYGGVELLKVGGTYYSRTKTIYISDGGISRSYVCWRGFYLAISGCGAPFPCHGGDMAQYVYGHVCLLEGDYESYYWIYRWLADGSIVVMDEERRCYHVEKGKDKKYIGRGGTEAGGNVFRTAIDRLAENAEAKVNTRAEEREDEARRALDSFRDAVPFRAGRKWGLKAGGKIIVPPIYRNVKSPVGRYCAVEKSYSQWGIIAIDGTVIIEPKYQDVAIMDNDTALLTFVTGKKKSVKLQEEGL